MELASTDLPETVNTRVYHLFIFLKVLDNLVLFQSVSSRQLNFKDLKH